MPGKARDIAAYTSLFMISKSDAASTPGNGLISEWNSAGPSWTSSAPAEQANRIASGKDVTSGYLGVKQDGPDS